MRQFTTTFIGTLLVSFTALAQIPAELQDLLPAGSTSVRMEGLTKDQKKCRVAISTKGDVFSADVYVLKADGQLDSRRLAKFQIGFGHELQALQDHGDVLTARSAHEAEEGYSSDTRSTLKVQFKDNFISAVQVHEESKGWFSYRTQANETCLLP